MSAIYPANVLKCLLHCLLLTAIVAMVSSPQSFASDGCTEGFAMKTHLLQLRDFFERAKGDPLGAKHSYCGQSYQLDRDFFEGGHSFLKSLEERYAPIGIPAEYDGWEGRLEYDPVGYWFRRVLSVGIYGAQKSSSKTRQFDANELKEALSVWKAELDIFCDDSNEVDVLGNPFLTPPIKLDRVIRAAKEIPALGEKLLQDFECKASNVADSRTPAVSAAQQPAPPSAPSASAAHGTATREAGSAR